MRGAKITIGQVGRRDAEAGVCRSNARTHGGKIKDFSAYFQPHWRVQRSIKWLRASPGP